MNEVYIAELVSTENFVNIMEGMLLNLCGIVPDIIVDNPDMLHSSISN